MRKNRFWMLLLCMLPLALIFILPLAGVRLDTTWLIAIVILAGCLLPMLFMRSRGINRDDRHH